MSLGAIFETSCEEFHRTKKELEKASKKIDSNLSWQQILSSYTIKIKNEKELLSLYEKEINKIKGFLKKKDLFVIPRSQKIKIEPTPYFLRPIRASASYSSPFTKDLRESAQFYITSAFIRQPHRKKVLDNIHNEYMFVTAHETYPGHHFLDTVRRNLKNPIREQIESPLFYEGWASYSERLIDELGFIKNPLQRLIGLKREAWRNIRAMLDVGIRINRLQTKDAQKLLENLGYEKNKVRLMIGHYLLTPGYQLCYTTGKFEINLLRKRYAEKTGLKKFHQLLLEGGQIPFNLVEARIKDYLCKKNF